MEKESTNYIRPISQSEIDERRRLMKQTKKELVATLMFWKEQNEMFQQTLENAKTKDCTIELINELGNNIKTISYNAETEIWHITYKNGLSPDAMNEDDILNFLRNG